MKDFLHFRDNFIMKIKTTPAEAPYSNGICECHHAIKTDIVLKVRDTKLKKMINVSVFSPQPLVLDKNINLSSIYNDKRSTNLPQNEIVIVHSSVLHVTRQAFMAAESSQKLKVAPQRKTHQTREHSEDGSHVYYNRMTI